MSVPTQNTGVVAAGLARLTSAYATKPGVRKILTALLTPKQELENVLFAVYVGRRLSTATLYALPTTNSVLDAIGKLVGQPRNAMSDAEYQAVLFLAVAVNRSNGRIGDWSKFAAILLHYFAGGPVELLEGTAAFDFGVLDFTGADADNIVVAVAGVLAKAVPNGVRASFVYSTWSSSLNFTFGSVYDGTAGPLGLGSIYDGSVGGKLVASLSLPVIASQ